jgi:predicted nucleic acid-binding protein
VIILDSSFVIAYHNDVFRRQSKATLSFADAAIVAIAERRNAQHVATFDADFKRVEGILVVPGVGASY